MEPAFFFPSQDSGPPSLRLQRLITYSRAQGSSTVYPSPPFSSFHRTDSQVGSFSQRRVCAAVNLLGTYPPRQQLVIPAGTWAPPSRPQINPRERRELACLLLWSSSAELGLHLHRAIQYRDNHPHFAQSLIISPLPPNRFSISFSPTSRDRRKHRIESKRPIELAQREGHDPDRSRDITGPPSWVTLSVGWRRISPTRIRAMREEANPSPFRVCLFRVFTMWSLSRADHLQAWCLPSSPSLSRRRFTSSSFCFSESLTDVFMRQEHT